MHVSRISRSNFPKNIFKSDYNLCFVSSFFQENSYGSRTTTHGSERDRQAGDAESSSKTPLSRPSTPARFNNAPIRACICPWHAAQNFPSRARPLHVCSVQSLACIPSLWHAHKSTQGGPWHCASLVREASSRAFFRNAISLRHASFLLWSQLPTFAMRDGESDRADNGILNFGEEPTALCQNEIKHLKGYCNSKTHYE